MTLPVTSGCVLWLDAEQDQDPWGDDSDSFNRADDATTLGFADVGGAWITTATWGISSNRAYVPAGSLFSVATLIGAPDGTVSATLPVVGGNLQGNGGIVFRYTDVNNYWRAFFDGTSGLVFIQKLVGGVSSNVYSGSSFVAGDTISVVLAGSSITLKKNGSTLTTITDAFNSTAHRHGMWINGDPIWRIDDYSFDGSASLLADGDPMLIWTDRSGLGNDAIIQDNPPIWRTNQRNGIAAVDFNQTDEQSFSLPDNLFDPRDGTTFIAAYARSFGDGVGVGPGGYFLDARATALTKRWALSTTTDSGGGWSTLAGASGSAVLSTRLDWGIIAQRGDGDDKRAAAKCGDDTTFTDTAVGVAVTASIGRISLASQEWVNGQIGEVIHYDRALTDTEWDDTIAYLKGKWAVSCGGWSVDTINF